MPLNDEDLCELSREDLAKIIARLKGEIPTNIDLPDNSFVVGASVTQSIVDVAVPNIFRLKAHVVAWSDTLAKFKSFDMDMAFMDGKAEDSVRNVKGNGLNINYVFDKVGTNLQLDLTNNEASDIQVRISWIDYVNI